MAYLTAEQREQLLQELKTMRFNRAKGYVRGKDPKSRLVFFRNAQGTGRWLTRYDLPTLGTRVTLVETNYNRAKGVLFRSEYTLAEIIVEALPENKT